MKEVGRCLIIVAILAHISSCFGSYFVGLAKNIDSVSFGTLDIKSGTCTLFGQPLPFMTFNAPQFAYSATTNLYSFIAYDPESFNSVLLSLNASNGAVVFNASIAGPPLPFGLAYDIQGNLYGQVWWPNGTAQVSTINAKTSIMQSTAFSWSYGSWTFVDSTFSSWNDTYFSLYVSNTTETLVGFDITTNKVTMNVTLDLDTTLGVATQLQYNNATNTFYVIGFNNASQTYDLATVDHTSGALSYLNIFTNATLSDITGVGLDNIANILSIVYMDSYTTMLVSVDLKSGAIIGPTKLSSNSISSMLALTNL